MSANTMLGWHFLAEDRRMQYNSPEVVKAGHTYSAIGPLGLCINGMHASRWALDALSYAPGPIVCRVKLLGKIIHDTDKAVARSRKVLWMANAARLLDEFALSVITNVLLLTDTTDPRLWMALNVKSRWLRGQATDQELDTARAAVREVANEAAAGTTQVETTQVVAWIAMRAADRAATSGWSFGAAGSAAWTATAAARTAAGAVGAADWKAAWAAYNVQLETMLYSLKPDP